MGASAGREKRAWERGVAERLREPGRSERPQGRHARRAPLALALAAGCFDPQIRSGAFRCADDEPLCPPGQICGKSGYCVDRDVSADAGPRDLGVADARDAGRRREPIDLRGRERPDGGVGPCADERLEPNGLFDLASPIGEGTIDGLEICWPGDVDYYKVPLALGQRLHATLRFTHALGDLDAAIQSPVRQTLDVAQSASNDEVLEMLESQAATVEGDFRVVVVGYQNATNSYRLEVEVLP